MEWAWARSNNEYPTKANGMDLEKLGTEILDKYSVSQIPKDPAENDEFDISLEGMTATAGSEQAGSETEGLAKYVLDNNTGTLWHSSWAGAEREDLWIDIRLPEKQLVDGIRLLPRTSGTNGVITKYRIEVSADNGQSYQEVSSGTWSSGNSWKKASFSEVEATNVRVYAVESLSTDSNNYASATEIRITGPKKVEVPVDKAELQEAYDKAAKMDLSMYTEQSRKVMEDAIANAKAVLDDEKSAQETVDEALKRLQEAEKGLELIPSTPVKKKILRRNWMRQNNTGKSLIPIHL